MKQRPTIGDKLHIFRVDQTVNTDRTVPRAKQLTSASKNGTSVSYTYNVSGIRDSQTVNGTTYSYITQNGQVVRQQWGDNVLDIIYDNNGQPNEMVYNGAHYYYILNQQGDVIALAASNGSIMAR